MTIDEGDGWRASVSEQASNCGKQDKRNKRAKRSGMMSEVESGRQRGRGGAQGPIRECRMQLAVARPHSLLLVCSSLKSGLSS